MSSPEAGERLGKYRLLKLVGQGGMASVYRAVDVDLDRVVAVKILHPHLQSRRDARRRFRREAKSVARITHRNILTIYDYSGEDARTSYLVTQFISGPHLKLLADKWGPFPHELVAAMAKQVTDGLIEAHSSGIVHRDVKPENILIDEEGVLKIADFGIALIADTQEMTATGQILGSPYYMSPEHVLGKGLDERADVFSFGSLLYWMVTGRQAFEGPNPHAVLKKIVEGAVEPVERLAPAAGQAIGRIIRTCHIRERDERPRTLQPVAEMLDRYMSMSGVEDPVAEVKRFLDSPETYRSETKPRSVKALMRAGDASKKEGKTAAALDAYNRVLALDPEHSGALRRVQDVATARSRRRLMTRLGVLAAAALVLFGVIFYGPRLMAAFGWSPGGDDGTVLADLSGAADATSEPAVKPDAAADSTPVVEPPPPAFPKDGSTDGKKVDAAKPVKKPAGKRQVKFVPYPKTVVIYVDGKVLGEYINNQTAELDVGRHKIRFEPTDLDCCEPAEWEVSVLPAKPGAKPQSIGKRLALNPATLYVFCDKPAKVSLDGGSITGSRGKPIIVPMKGSLARTVTVTVSADGFKTVTRKLVLHAGKSKQEQVKMEPVTE